MREINNTMWAPTRFPPSQLQGVYQRSDYMHCCTFLFFSHKRLPTTNRTQHHIGDCSACPLGHVARCIPGKHRPGLVGLADTVAASDRRALRSWTRREPWPGLGRHALSPVDEKVQGLSMSLGHCDQHAPSARRVIKPAGRRICVRALRSEQPTRLTRAPHSIALFPGAVQSLVLQPFKPWL